MKIMLSRSSRRRLPRVTAQVESGQAIVILVLAIVALIGFTAIAIDGGNAYYIRRNMQNAADAGVVAGLQQYLDIQINNTGEDEQITMLEVINQAAERNGVEDTDGTPGNCINDNVLVWYVDGDGNQITTGVEPARADGQNITRTDCTSAVVTPDWDGIHVMTKREFDTFLASIIGQSRLAAEGSASAVIEGEIVGCTGEYAAFAMDPSSPNAINVSGTHPDPYEIIGDVHASTALQITGAGASLAIDGNITYVTSFDYNADIWIGPVSEAGDDINGSCGTAPVPGDWTFRGTAVPNSNGGAEICIYNAGGNYQDPMQVAPVTPPLIYDYDDFDITKNGQYARDAAGCDFGSCTTTPGLSIAGGTWTRYGSDYYYYTGGGTWALASDTMPTGIYFVPGQDISMSGAGTTVNINEYTTIVTDGTIHFTGGTLNVDPTEPWKPYGGYDGSGAALMTTSTSNGAIQLSGVSGLSDMEGIWYAPNGTCTISGSTSLNGAMVCYQIDASGSTGSISFDLTYCPPPDPSIVFKN